MHEKAIYGGHHPTGPPVMVCRRHGEVRIDKILQSHCPVGTTFKQVCPECESKLQIFH